MSTSYEEMMDDWDSDKPKEAVWDPMEFCNIEDDADTYDQFEPLIEEFIVECNSALERFSDVDVKETKEPSEYYIAGMEVGDDRIDISNSPRVLAVCLAAQSFFFQMGTSEKDTSISGSLFNLCEVISGIPRSRFGGIYDAKIRGFEKLEFVDVPPMRIIVDSQKASRDHSSSAVGKSQMLGSRSRAIRTNCSPVMNAASWIQDGMLNTSKSREPKYIPWVMGGSACPAVWGDFRNIFLHVHSYKGGTYERIYGTASVELRSCVRDLDVGRVTQPVICSALRMKLDYLKITYGEHIVIPRKRLENPFSKEVIRPAYKALGGTAALAGAESRLLQTKRLMTLQGAETALESSRRIHDFVSGLDPIAPKIIYQKDLKMEQRRKFDYAISSNAAIQRLLLRQGGQQDLKKLIGDENFLTTGGGTLEFTPLEAEWLHRGARGEAYNATDLIFSEDMYFREDVDKSSLLQVGGIHLTPSFSKRAIRRVVTVVKTGLWETTEEMEDWADRVCSELRELRDLKGIPGYQQVRAIYDNNREWFADDPTIYEKVREFAATKTAGLVLVITSDSKLCRKISFSTGLQIAMVHPYQAYKYVGADMKTDDMTFDQVLGFKPGLQFVKNCVPGANAFLGPVIPDLGSIKASLSQLSEEGEGPNRVLYHDKPVESRRNDDGTRTEVFFRKRLRDLKEDFLSKVVVHYPNRTIRVRQVVPTGEKTPVMERLLTGKKYR